VKFFLDHDVAAAVKDALERHEHEVIRLIELLPRNAPDEAVFAAAQDNQCVMITCNRNDFLRLAAKRAHLGLIILVRRRSPQVECTNLLRLIRRAGEQGLRGNINFA
jgi:predicted nuclease of predicted toxin-antitoxin system